MEFIAPLVADDPRVPPWALDLARHEALDILVGSIADAPKPGVLPELDPDRGLAFSATARIARYDFAVHRASADPSDANAPEHAATALFVYRSPEHDVRYLEVTPLAAAILEHLLTGQTLRQALDRATRELGVPLDAAVLDGTARVLSDLAERGAVFGAREGGSTTVRLDQGPDDGTRSPEHRRTDRSREVSHRATRR
jgi:hypothetical protein